MNLHFSFILTASAALLAGCSPVDRVSLGFGRDILIEPEGNRKGWYEQTKLSSYVNPIVRMQPLIKAETFSIHPVAEFELTDKRSSFTGIGGEFVYPLFEKGQLNVLGTTGMHWSDFTRKGSDEFFENLHFGFQLGYSHELDDKIWLGLHYNHGSDAEIGRYNNVTRDGLLLTIGYGF